MLAPGDVERIAVHLHATKEQVEGMLLASPGAKVGKLIGREVVVFRIPTIVPKQTEHGCVFLDNGRCKVHPVAPYGCAYFDSHMDAKEGAARSGAALNAIVLDVEYQATWQRLRANGQISDTPDAKRARMRGDEKPGV